MHLYLNYACEHWMVEGENPPVGLILCAEKYSAVAHHALEGLPNKVLAAEYRTVLPKEPLLVAEIERTIHAIETYCAAIPRWTRQGTVVAENDQPRCVADACAFARGLAMGARRARITFQPFRAFAALATRLATSVGSTRSAEMRLFDPYSAAKARRSAGRSERLGQEAKASGLVHDVEQPRREREIARSGTMSALDIEKEER